MNCQGIEMHVERSSKSTEMPAEVEMAKNILQKIEEEEKIGTIKAKNELCSFHTYFHPLFFVFFNLPIA